jgi:hypothetical protein
MLKLETKTMNLAISKSKRTKRAIIPKELLEELELAGAVVELLDEGSLYAISKIDYGDQAWNVYKNWAIEADNDPIIGAGFFPSASIINSTICPSVGMAHQIQVEANSLIMAYSNLRIQDFANGNVPVIVGPVLAPPMVTNVRHVTIAVSKMMEGIQTHHQFIQLLMH